jgi:hypothetical protein
METKKERKLVGFEVLTAVSTKTAIFKRKLVYLKNGVGSTEKYGG